MNLEALKEAEYVKCVDILAELIDLEEDEKEILRKGFQSMGISNFFLHLDTVDLSPEMIEKLRSMKAIIDLSDAKRGRV